MLGVLVTTGLIMGFIVGGNPEDLKDLKYDANRLATFDNIKYSIQDYYEINSKLPASLSNLQILPGKLKDPKTQEAYSYSTISLTSYKLCANFSTDSEEFKDKYDRATMSDDETKHKKGFDCITYTVYTPVPVTRTR